MAVKGKLKLTIIRPLNATVSYLKDNRGSCFLLLSVSNSQTVAGG